MEIWKSAVGYEGLLEVSNMGRVKSLKRVCHCVRMGVPSSQTKREIVLTPHVDSKGYLEVNPRIGAKQLKLRVHRLVALAFVPGYFDGAHVNHIDAVKTNNSPDNLEWVTNLENIQHAIRLGLTGRRGELNPNCKLSDQDVIEVRRLRDTGMPVKLIMAKFGITDDMVYGIGTRKMRSWLPEAPSSKRQSAS